MPDFDSRRTFPVKLEASNCRIDGQDGQVIVTFGNARHFADVVAFARQVDRQDQFAQMLLELLGVAIGYAASRPASRHIEKRSVGEDIEHAFPAAPGSSVELRLVPDWPSQKDPSFSWAVIRDQRTLLNGGFIWHPSEGGWTLHS